MAKTKVQQFAEALARAIKAAEDRAAVTDSIVALSNFYLLMALILQKAI